MWSSKQSWSCPCKTWHQISITCSSYVPELSYSRCQLGTNYSNPFGKLPFLSCCSPAPYSLSSFASGITLGFSKRKRHIPALPKVKMELHGGEKHWWKSDSPCLVGQAPHARASLSLSHKFHLPLPLTPKQKLFFMQWPERSESSETERKTDGSPGPFLFLL